MDITRHTTALEQFRYTLYQNFENRADTLMELVDAISSYPNAQSVVEYSLAPPFRRSYSTIFKGIDASIGLRVTGCGMAIEQLDYTARLGNINKPTLVMVGEDDPGTPVEAAELIHQRIPSARRRGGRTRRRAA